MRATLIITIMLLLFTAVFAQQERQMQHPAAVVKSNGQVTPAAASPSEPRKMVPLAADKTVPAKGNSVSNVSDNNEKRAMVPLNPNEPAKKKN